MLKITNADQKRPEVLLRLEGDITSKWVEILDKEIRGHLEKGAEVNLDLCGVIFVDRRGAKMLKGLLGGSVRVSKCTPLVESLLGKGR